MCGVLPYIRAVCSFVPVEKRIACAPVPALDLNFSKFLCFNLKYNTYLHYQLPKERNQQQNKNKIQH